MLIGIDAHNLEGKRTGVGRYLLNILKHWNQTTNSEAKFKLYFQNECPADLSLKPELFEMQTLKLPRRFSSNALFMHTSLPHAAKKDNVDILFCPAYIAPLRYNQPFALTLHDIVYEARPKLYNWPSPVDRILLKRFSRKSAQKAKIIFTPTEFTKKEVIKYYALDPSKILVTHEAADEHFKPVEDHQPLKAIKEKYQIEDKFIFYIGSIFSRRHIFEAIGAFQKIAQDHHEYQFVIVGANHTRPWIDINRFIEETNKLLNRKAIIHLDYLYDQDLVLFYNAADLLIWLSDYEGFGLPVLEAMACGTPVVTSYKTSLPEVAGDAALYVRNNKNIDEIAETMYKAMTDKALRLQMIKKGLNQVSNFSWAKCAQKTLEALLKS